MVPHVIVGCCGWSEAQQRYVQNFPAIELQTTFYEPPATRVAERWRALAPQGFHFCMKAWQLITHTPSSPTYRRLKSGVSPTEHDAYGSFRPTEQVALAWERTRAIAATLDARVVVFQCPRSFLPTSENARNLRSFFGGIERDGRTLAWEPRGEDWRPSLVRELCTELDLVHCVDPFQNDPAREGLIYWRLHGKAGYRYQYTEADLQELHGKVREHAQAPGPHYIMFNNIYSRQDALRYVALRDWSPI